MWGVSSCFKELDIRDASVDILCTMTKHLVDLDDDLLAKARAELGTNTIKDTVNEALRRSSEKRLEQIADSLDTLAAAHLEDREAAWR
jgi:Arc/MetJ family transcription regulator